jgi:hypothetical protein
VGHCQRARGSFQTHHFTMSSLAPRFHSYPSTFLDVEPWHNDNIGTLTLTRTWPRKLPTHWSLSTGQRFLSDCLAFLSRKLSIATFARVRIACTVANYERVSDTRARPSIIFNKRRDAQANALPTACNEIVARNFASNKDLMALFDPSSL